MTVKSYSLEVLSANLAANPAETPGLDGFLHSISYVKDPDTNAAFDTDVDFRITLDDSGEAVWTEDDVNASETIYPRPIAQKIDGTELLYATGEEVPVGGGFLLANTKIKVVVIAPGTAKRGTFIFKLVGKRG